MSALRRLSQTHSTLVLWLALIVLAVKLLVPAGFMVGVVDGRVGLQICSGFTPAAAMPMGHRAMAQDAETAMAPDHAMAPGHAVGDHGKQNHPAADMPCPFAALSHGVAVPIDPVLLAVALAFILALGFAASAWPRPRVVPYLRPPLRGPPPSA